MSCGEPQGGEGIASALATVSSMPWLDVVILGSENVNII
jgi:hypothetical protein